MESRNPVLSRPNVWSPNQTSSAYPANNTQPGPQGQPYVDQYGQPYIDPNGQPVEAAPSKGVMTLDDVVLKTGILFAILAVSAAATWLLVPNPLVLPVALVASLAGIVTVALVSFRRKVSPALVFVYAVVEGVFVGAFSKFFEYLYNGIVGQAILATFVAAGVTLAAYKFLKIRVTPMFQRVVMIATISFAALLLVNFVLALFGMNLGLRGVGGTPSLLMIGISAIAVVLAVLNLILDFDHIQRGIEMRAPAEQSWIAAFGLMVTMVWLYIELLRILSYFRN